MNFTIPLKVFFFSIFFTICCLHDGYGQLDSLLSVVQTLPDGKEKCDVYKDIAYGYYNEKPDLALLYCDTLYSLAKKIKYSKRVNSSYYLRSTTLYVKGQYQEALSAADMAIEGFEKDGDIGNTAITYEFKGTIYRAISLTEKATKEVLKALKMYEEIEDSVGIAYACMNLGVIFIDIKDFETANRYIGQAIETIKPYKYHAFLANAYNSLTNTITEPKEKLPLLEKALKYAQMAGDTYYSIAIYANLASYYKEINDIDRAIEASNKSLALAHNIGETNSIAEQSIYLGSYYLTNNQYDSAMFFLTEGVEIAKSYNFLYSLQQGYYFIAKSYENQGNTSQALQYLHLAYNTSDSIYNKETAERIQTNAAKYEFEKNQRTIAEQQLAIANSKNTLNRIIIGALLLLGLMASIYQWYLYRQRQKKQAAELALTLQQEESNRLRELDELKTNFFTNISHELRTPLTLILSPLADVLESVNAVPIKNKLKTVQSNAQRLLTLVNEIMDLSKAEVGKLSVNYAGVNLIPFSKRVFAAFESLAAIRHIDLKLETDITVSEVVKLDIEKMEKILNNLLSNAIKYTDAGGTVALSIFKKEGQYIFEVQDTGRGVHPDDQPHIFNRFYQAKKGGEPLQGGTGVGLALSKELAKLLGGSLTFTSELGKGSTFTFAVPLQEAAIQLPILNQKEKGIGDFKPFVPTYQPLQINGTKPRLLIVEDNLEMSRYLVEILSTDYQCTTAADGQEALKQLRLYTFDCITSDVMMPNMDGFGLRAAINQNPAWKQVPFLLLTARHLESDKLKGFQLGIDDYVTKPFSTKELQARIHNLVANKIERDNFKKNERLDKVDAERLSVHQDILQSCEQAVLANLDNIDFKVGDLAAAVNQSPKQLGRTIKKLTGLSTVGFILEIRLQKARELLEKGLCATVLEAQYEVGISSTSYFTKKFTERFGKNPKEVRQV